MRGDTTPGLQEKNQHEKQSGFAVFVVWGND
jgi:hypothetical protein